MSSQEIIYYCNPVFRPPSEGNSLLIQLTEGCTFKCDFCMSNLRKNFKIRSVDEVKRDLDIGARSKYSPSVHKLFFLDGNAMVTPVEKLLELTNYAMKKFPNLERVGVYAHAKDILKKSDDDLKALSNAGLKIAYVGFESGSDELLKMVHKNATKTDFINASKKLMKADITLSATFINGLGGANNESVSKIHALESADLVNEICPDDERIWYIAFLSLMVPPGTVMHEKKLRNIETINFPNKSANCIFRSNHASNYLPVRGVLERDKSKILNLIESGLKNRNILRAEHYRAL